PDRSPIQAKSRLRPLFIRLPRITCFSWRRGKVKCSFRKHWKNIIKKSRSILASNKTFVKRACKIFFLCYNNESKFLFLKGHFQGVARKENSLAMALFFYASL